MQWKRRFAIYNSDHAYAFKVSFEAFIMDIPPFPQERLTEALNMDRCQVCNEPIWDTQWPAGRDREMKKFVCFYCFSKIHEGGDYKPAKLRKDELIVCDRCGRLVDSARKIKGEWVCDDCRS